LIAEGAPSDQIKALARTEGCLTFHKDGLRLVAEGKTSLEELQRVFKG
jgi:type IV pilus assembly protein PilB